MHKSYKNKHSTANVTVALTKSKTVLNSKITIGVKYSEILL